MTKLISSREAAKQLGIAVDDIEKLVNQEIIHPGQETKNGYLFEKDDIDRIASNEEPTVSEEAAQVGVQIQQEVVYAVSGLQKLWRRLAAVIGAGIFILVMAVLLIAVLFKVYPDKLSDFFGYYYRFNSAQQTALNKTSDQTEVLGTSTESPDAAGTNISMLASLTKPIAAASLLIIKAADDTRYVQIVQKPPTTPSSQPGPSGATGRAGANGKNGEPGPIGSVGLGGSNGVDGSDGKNGLDGINGLTTESDTLSAVTSRGALTNSPVTLNGGLTVASSLNLPTGSVAIDYLAVGDYTAKITSGTYGINISGNASTAATANDFSGLLSGDVTGLQNTTAVTKINGNTLGSTAPTAGNLLIGDGAAWQSKALSGNANLDSNGVLTVNGLTIANFSSTNISQFTNDAGYSTASTTEALSNKTISGLSNTLAGISNASLDNSSITINTLGILAGGGMVSLGDTIDINGTESDTLAAVTARGATTSANIVFSGGLTFSGPITLSGLTGCQSLATDSSGTLQCGSSSSNNDSAVAFTDDNPATLSDSNYTELFNDSSKPSITPASSGQNVLVSVHARFEANGNSNTTAAVRIVRNVGSPANCYSSTQVGDTFSTFLTDNHDSQNATATFLDTPSTTSTIYYTVCSSYLSDFGNIPDTQRVDVTLLRIGS